MKVDRVVPSSTQPDPWKYSARWAVRSYELDRFGHVNNAVYLNWVEQAAMEHAELLGFGSDWSRAQNGGWIVREHHVTYHRPLVYGDEVLVTSMPQRVGPIRAVRLTEICRQSDGALATEIATVWVWIDDRGRPSRLPAEVLAAFRRSGIRSGEINGPSMSAADDRASRD